LESRGKEGAGPSYCLALLPTDCLRFTAEAAEEVSL